MSDVTSLPDLLSAMPNASSVNDLLTSSSGSFRKVTHRAAANFVLSTVNNLEDLDNPTSKGVFSVGPDTPITRPSKGSGWQFGFVINLALASGIQIWVNYSGYIAVRGKGSAGGQWSEWQVAQPIA